MKFRLETMVNTYNVRSKASCKKGHKLSVLFNQTTTKISKQLKEMCDD
ncbi:MAG: hypothetical protein K6E29_04090 [Cyanobacteria bacterium RUI128]|nr:hypothetical protein [Cyanobacteria bacterium RUI128]